MGLIWGNTVIKKIICYKASGYIIQAIGLFAKRHGASGSDFELAQNWRWWELTTKWWSYTTKAKNSVLEKYEKNAFGCWIVGLHDRLEWSLYKNGPSKLDAPISSK